MDVASTRKETNSFPLTLVYSYLFYGRKQKKQFQAYFSKINTDFQALS